ncbi:MAG: hypothetical protein ACFFB2_11690 [Promethearchaeota archaeon]
MSKERRHISQRKIRRIKRVTKPEEVESRSETTTGLAPNTKMYYTKVSFGVCTGLVTGFLFVVSEVFLNWWLLILVLALVTCVLFVRYVLKISSEDIDQKRLWLSGTFTFLVLFIVMTSLVWMIF